MLVHPRAKTQKFSRKGFNLGELYVSSSSSSSLKLLEWPKQQRHHEDHHMYVYISKKMMTNKDITISEGEEVTEGFIPALFFPLSALTKTPISALPQRKYWPRYDTPCMETRRFSHKT